MTRFAILLSAGMAIVAPALATDAFGRAPAIHGPEADSRRKADIFLPRRAIEPMAAKEEKPRAGWSGFYGGLNAGAARDR
ncbi:hypothetical protein OGR47_11655 [Methylocystis sp. MJC1]|jgi:hypothetical protein|uniref:hypothetical protein n=1 Tax=Methylocystis sp. MJC1 TaxID=2654282 RepID=UPI0013EB2788|nr:hypothetical protein [Methylocystis sp. MJC1]KAF2990109.1 hypothetical protein MJC1_02769 [Methylocystis sp. MJC1]MBU6527635.1 hypothetical protein [Methylocystis sp. MJC1]UZX10575.1 hypothetical protein OGR47_11655 [Methylocystis sp. MJC1]